MTASVMPARFGPRTREVRNALELFALCGIAVAQPTFDLLGKNTGIFATRGSTGLDIVLVTLAVLFVPAAVLYGIEVVVGLVYPPARRAAHALLCGLPFGIFVEEILKRTTDLAPVRLVHLGVLAGLLGALAFYRLEWVRLWLRYLAIAPALFAALFLFASPASAVVFGGSVEAKSGVEVGNPKRVVMVMLDELPLQSLLDGQGAIDAEMFPNFAALSQESTWYRNTTTVAPYTERAVPAILTGRLPPKGTVVPTADDYPENLFTLLGGVYPFNVHEAVTRLCPPSSCDARATDATGLARTRQLGEDVVRLWRTFASPQQSEVNFGEESFVQFGVPQARRFVRSLEPAEGPRLDFVHVGLPHAPWHLYPDLQDTMHFAPQKGASKLVWQEDEWPAESARRQHLLQVQATDTLLGEVLDRIKAVDGWEDSLVIVTADHGVAFKPQEGIRSITDEAGGNYEQILWTPLFVKYPGEQGGTVDDRPVQSIDVLPTIADVLDLEMPWKVDGVSMLGEPRADFPRQFDQTKGSAFAPPQAMFPPDGQRYLELDPAGFQVVLGRRGVEGGGDPGLRIFRVGPYGDLVGRTVDDYEQAPPGRPSLAHIGGPLVADFRGGPTPSYDQLDPARRLIPWAYFEGIVDDLTEDTWVAIALNGTVVGIGQALPLDGTTSGTLSTVLAPQLVEQGPNEITLWALSGDPSAPTLQSLPVYSGPGE